MADAAKPRGKGKTPLFQQVGTFQQPSDPLSLMDMVEGGVVAAWGAEFDYTKGRTLT